MVISRVNTSWLILGINHGAYHCWLTIIHHCHHQPWNINLLIDQDWYHHNHQSWNKCPLCFINCGISCCFTFVSPPVHRHHHLLVVSFCNVLVGTNLPSSSYGDCQLVNYEGHYPRIHYLIWWSFIVMNVGTQVLLLSLTMLVIILNVARYFAHDQLLHPESISSAGGKEC